jgi:hypothetical protein
VARIEVLWRGQSSDGLLVPQRHLALRERICQKDRSGEVGPARSASDRRSTLPCFGRRVGADPISFWGASQFKPRNGTLAASRGFDQRSTIALASSRILELAATVIEEWLTTRPPHPVRAHRCQAEYPLIRISPFDTSTVPRPQTWIGFSHAYSGWLVVSVTFSRS